LGIIEQAARPFAFNAYPKRRFAQAAFPFPGKADALRMLKRLACHPLVDESQIIGTRSCPGRPSSIVKAGQKAMPPLASSAAGFGSAFQLFRKARAFFGNFA
jgi:hypothetical protein